MQCQACDETLRAMSAVIVFNESWRLGLKASWTALALCKPCYTRSLALRTRVIRETGQRPRVQPRAELQHR